MLDLASVGPAARASRWLADYGATVVKVGPVPKDEGVQIVPPFYAYSAHRRLQRALFDMKAPEGREAFLRLAERADVVIESFRPGVVDRLGVGWEATSARNPRLVYCATSGFGQTGPRSQWAGHDLNYLGVGGFLHCGGRARRRAAAGPRADRRRQRRRRDARGDGDPGRAGAAQHHRRGRVPRRVDRRRRARRSWPSRSTSTSPPVRSPGPGTACSPAATRATTRTRRATATGSRSPPSSPGSGPTCASSSASSSGRHTSTTTRCRTRSAPIYERCS